jgi:hypothetical protein
MIALFVTFKMASDKYPSSQVIESDCPAALKEGIRGFQGASPYSDRK